MMINRKIPTLPDVASVTAYYSFFPIDVLSVELLGHLLLQIIVCVADKHFDVCFCTSKLSSTRFFDWDA